METPALNGTQLPLLDAESDEALLLPPEEKRKRYTGRQVSKLEERLDCIVTMLAWGIPDERVAQAAHVNFRTLAVIKGKLAERIGTDALGLAAVAAGKSSKFLMLADQKAEGASAKDLMIMHGIARDTAINLKLTAGAENLDPAIDVPAVSPALEVARKLVAAKDAGSNAGTQRQQPGCADDGRKTL